MSYALPFAAAALAATPAIALWIALARRREPVSLRRLLIAATTIGALCRVVFALWTPTFYAPDEQSHFNYVRYLYQQRALPVQVSQADAPSNDWEYYQPPLYYLLCLPVYAVAEGMRAPVDVAVRALRFVSIGCWAATLVLARRLLARLGLLDAPLQAGTVAMVACLPTYTFLSASINNDNLLVAIGALLLYVLAGPTSPRRSLLLGLLLGAALLTKLNAVVYVVAIAALLAIRWVGRDLTPGAAMANATVSYAVAALLVLPWAARNVRVYGDLTAETIANIPFRWRSAGHAARTIVTYLAESFWSVSGIYNNVEYLPQLGIALGVLACYGLIAGAARAGPLRVRLAEGSCRYLLAMSVAIAANIGLVARFGWLYNQGQGRFMFPLLAPVAILTALGITCLPGIGRARRLPVHLAGFWATYVMSFVAYSLAVFYRS